jgi:hypothetical protein
MPNVQEMRHEKAPLFLRCEQLRAELRRQPLPARGGTRGRLERTTMSIVVGVGKLFNASPVTRRLRIAGWLQEQLSECVTLLRDVAETLLPDERRQALLDLARRIADEVTRRAARLRALALGDPCTEESEEPIEIEVTSEPVIDEEAVRDETAEPVVQTSTDGAVVTPETSVAATRDSDRAPPRVMRPSRNGPSRRSSSPS